MKNKYDKRSLIWFPVVLLVLFVVVCGFLVLAYKHNQASFLRKAPSAHIVDPFLDKTKVGVDFGVPKVNGVTVPNPRCDRDKLLDDAKQMDIEFRRSLSKFKADGEKKKADILSKRNLFAARRLEILKALENAKTPEERRDLIEKLKNIPLMYMFIVTNKAGSLF